MLSLHTGRVNVKKNKNKESEVQKQKELNFSAKLDTIFKIAHKNLESIIEADRLRSEKDKEDDLRFLQDQHTERKMTLGRNDSGEG